MIFCNVDVGETLVIAQQHIVFGPEPLDQVRFQQQCFCFGARADKFHARSFADHARNAIGLTHHPGVIGDPLLEAACLADIQHVTRDAIHAINARIVGQFSGKCQNDLGAGSYIFPVRVWL